MAEVLWYLSEYMDEVMVHPPTLEGAAHFLQYGRDLRDVTDDDAPVWGAPPLAKPGDVVSLDSLTLLPDVKLVRVTRENGSRGWNIHPAPPIEADFLALRWGAEAGWDPDTICDPRKEADLDAHLNEVVGDDDFDEIEDVAIGIHGRALARFDLKEVDGVVTPELTLIGDDGPAVIARINAGDFHGQAWLIDGGLSASVIEPARLQWPSQAITDVLNERDRQIAHGFTADYDDLVNGGVMSGELAQAAATYAMAKTMPNVTAGIWPWPQHPFKPRTHRENCVRAAAMLIAEIERLDREEKREAA